MKRESRKVRSPNVPTPQNVFDIWGMKAVDPMGSYTGVPADPMEQPVQDADDL